MVCCTGYILKSAVSGGLHIDLTWSAYHQDVDSCMYMVFDLDCNRIRVKGLRGHRVRIRGRLRQRKRMGCGHKTLILFVYTIHVCREEQSYITSHCVRQVGWNATWT